MCLCVCVCVCVCARAPSRVCCCWMTFSCGAFFGTDELALDCECLQDCTTAKVTVPWAMIAPSNAAGLRLQIAVVFAAEMAKVACADAPNFRRVISLRWHVSTMAAVNSRRVGASVHRKCPARRPPLGLCGDAKMRELATSTIWRMWTTGVVDIKNRFEIVSAGAS